MSGSSEDDQKFLADTQREFFEKPIVASPVHDELCDIDDLPDCLIGGVHQPHCRHAGKTVTIGGNL